MEQSFGKQEKLKSKIFIGQLFEEGKQLKKYPIKVIYVPISSAEKKHQVGVSVPKRGFKNAVDRNYLKRLLREAYRKNKYLVASAKKSYALMFIYLGKEKKEFSVIEKQMQKLLNELATKVS